MYEYLLADTLTRQVWGSLDMSGVSFNGPLNESGAFEGTVVGDIQLLPSLRQLYLLGRLSLFVVEDTSIIWNGLVRLMEWDLDVMSVRMNAVETRSWFSELLAGGDTGTVPKKWTSKDQFTITRELITYVTDNEDAPYSIPISLGAGTSGITRNVILESQSYASVLDIINGYATLENGFDWELSARFKSTDGNPEIFLSMWYPERRSTAIADLYVSTNGGNAILSNWVDDISARRTRIHALGEGSTPKQTSILVQDVGTGNSKALLRVKSTNYAGRGFKTSQLTSAANSELKALKKAQGTVTVELVPGTLRARDFYVGDRVSLTINHPVINEYFPALKIVDRQISAEDRDKVATISLTLDLNDYEPPV